MAEILAVEAALTSLKAAVDITKAMAGVMDATKVQTLKFEIQQALIEAQSLTASAQMEQLSLIGRVSAAEAEVARLKEWKTQEGAYKLEEIPNSAFVYVSQPTGDAAATEVWLCPKCFGEQRHGVLTYGGQSKDHYASTWRCITCKTTIETEAECKPGHWRHRSEQLRVSREIQMVAEAKHLEALKKKRDEG